MAFGNTVTRLSELIADVITGAQIIGGSITGAFITADAAVLTNADIDTSLITDPDHQGGTITGTTMNASTVNATDINGGTITGAIFQTAVAGARWVMGTVGQLNSLIGYPTTGSVWPGKILVEQGLNGYTFARVLLQAPDVSNVGNRTATIITETRAGVDFTSDIALFVEDSVGNSNTIEVNSNDGVFIGQNGGKVNIGTSFTPIDGLALLTFGQNTNASGQLAVANPHGVTPAYVGIMTVGGPANQVLEKVVARNGGTITLQAINTTTGAASAAGVAFSGVLLLIF